MPHAANLPDDLQLLTRRNALELSDTHFHRDVDQLIVVLDRVLGTAISDTPQVGTSGSAPSGSRREERDSATPYSGSKMAAATSQPNAPSRVAAAPLAWGIVFSIAAFVIVSIVATLLGYGWTISTATGIAKLFFFLFLSLFVFFLVLGVATRRRM
jgi:uncharacterized membrane protein YtjA (UPF0391 family)